MSLGLAFVRGLVGGFQKNIDREKEARGADDARIAELENFIFEAATDPKKKVPKEKNMGKEKSIKNGKPKDIPPRDPKNLLIENRQEAFSLVLKTTECSFLG